MNKITLITAFLFFINPLFGQEDYSKFPSYNGPTETSLMSQRQVDLIQKDFLLYDGAHKLDLGMKYVLTGLFLSVSGAALLSYSDSDILEKVGFVSGVVGVGSSLIGAVYLRSGTVSLRKGHMINNRYLDML